MRSIALWSISCGIKSNGFVGKSKAWLGLWPPWPVPSCSEPSGHPTAPYFHGERGFWFSRLITYPTPNRRSGPLIKIKKKNELGKGFQPHPYPYQRGGWGISLGSMTATMATMIRSVSGHGVCYVVQLFRYLIHNSKQTLHSFFHGHLQSQVHSHSRPFPSRYCCRAMSLWHLGHFGSPVKF